MGTKVLGDSNDQFTAYKERRLILKRWKSWRIVGNGGDDTLTGGAKSDRIYGNADNDRLSGLNGNDYLSGGSGRDTLYGGNHNDRLYGGTENDYLNGGSGNDYLSGGAHNDRLYGGSGNDTIIGGSGNDILVGTDYRSQGTGERDVLRSGSYSDRDVFVLGESRRVYYNDRGNRDYALIQDFDDYNYRGDIADRIQLMGSASAYSLRNGSWNGVDGVGIYFGGDVIGVVQGFTTSRLNLYNSNQFTYV